MARFLLTDYDFPDLEIERSLFAAAGMELVEAQCRTEEDVIAASAGCQGLLIQRAPVAKKVFAARPEIRIASRYGAGFDTINVADARDHGVWVANSPDYGVGEVATHALALALASIRHLGLYDRDVRSGTWHHTSPGTIRRATDLTLGILGLGRIGKRMAHIARDCFRNVIACDPYLIDGDFPVYVGRVDLPTLFRTADIVSLHLPLNPETEGLVNGALLKSMKRGSYLVNTARGGVVDLDDLVEVLESGHLDAVGIDVLPAEPPPADHPLLGNGRSITTPPRQVCTTWSEAWRGNGRNAACGSTPSPRPTSTRSCPTSPPRSRATGAPGWTRRRCAG
jgi:phosphoglycerate dehydrogenase-like enzyme